VLVLLEPAPVRLPRQEADGPPPGSCGWRLGEADGAALEAALRLRDAAPGLVALQVAAAGPPAVGPLLREVLGLGVDRVRLAACAAEASPGGRGAALLPVLREGPPFDLILGGHTEGGPEALVARLTAAAPGVPYAGRAAALAVRATGTSAHVCMFEANGGPVREHELPAAVAVDAGEELRPFTVSGYLAGLARDVEVLPGTPATGAGPC
jgi:electron transfer flavoprotein alpha/beta subunit